MENKIREFALREAERGEAIVEPSTKEEWEEYGNDLVGWCSRCSKPFNGRWAGLVNFCPWCGRPVRWGEEEGKNT